MRSKRPHPGRPRRRQRSSSSSSRPHWPPHSMISSSRSSRGGEHRTSRWCCCWRSSSPAARRSSASSCIQCIWSSRYARRVAPLHPGVFAAGVNNAEESSRAHSLRRQQVWPLKRVRAPSRVHGGSVRVAWALGTVVDVRGSSARAYRCRSLPLRSQRMQGSA